MPCPVVDEDQGVIMTARWGEQLDVRHITEAGDHDQALLAEQVAGYVAKYATKSTEALGITLDHRVCEVELEGLDMPAHVVELVRPAGSWAPAPAWLGCGCANGRTCSASAATSRPRAAATPPPSAPCVGPESPTRSVDAVAVRSRWMPGADPRTTRR